MIAHCVFQEATRLACLKLIARYVGQGLTCQAGETEITRTVCPAQLVPIRVALACQAALAVLTASQVHTNQDLVSCQQAIVPSVLLENTVAVSALSMAAGVRCVCQAPIRQEMVLPRKQTAHFVEAENIKASLEQHMPLLVLDVLLENIKVASEWFLIIIAHSVIVENMRLESAVMMDVPRAFLESIKLALV